MSLDSENTGKQGADMTDYQTSEEAFTAAAIGKHASGTCEIVVTSYIGSHRKDGEN